VLKERRRRESKVLGEYGTNPDNSDLRPPPSFSRKTIPSSYHPGDLFYKIKSNRRLQQAQEGNTEREERNQRSYLFI
jgi:hypothetical protein